MVNVRIGINELNVINLIIFTYYLSDKKASLKAIIIRSVQVLSDSNLSLYQSD